MAEATISVSDAMLGVRILFLDTAPVIYHVEGNPRYVSIVREVFSRIETGETFAVTSPVTLAECITHPIRHKRPDLVERYTHTILHGKHTRFVETNSVVAQSTAQLRARYTLSLGDAMQFATAISAGCDAFLTNDVRLKRMNEIRVIAIDELTA